MTKNERARADALYELFYEYTDAYRSEWQRMERCERMYFGDSWRDIPQTDAKEPRPVMPIIFSTVENIKADLMDGMPEAVITADDAKHTALAERLTKVVRENHDRARYTREYAELIHDLLVCGTMIQETGCDLGDGYGAGGGFIRHVDCRSIMFDPTCTDIQDSRAVFKFTPKLREWYKAHYPKHEALMHADAADDLCMGNADTGAERILLIECWEREYDESQDIYRIHMCKLAGGQLLEDSRYIKPQGYYRHGKYPFVVTPLYAKKGSCLGLSVSDMFADRQQLADKLDQIVLKNALLSSHNKLLVTGASGFDTDDLCDWSKEVHRGDSLSGISWFSTGPLPSYLIGYIDNMRQSVKEESGANEFSRGNSTAGVTAASAISALQEMSSKRSRMALRLVHDAFCEAVEQELDAHIEFYGLTEAHKGCDCAMRPLGMSVSVKAQKQNRFSVLAHNELIIQLVKLGMLTPNVGLELMLFDSKEQALELMKKQARLGYPQVNLHG